MEGPKITFGAFENSTDTVDKQNHDTERGTRISTRVLAGMWGEERKETKYYERKWKSKYSICKL